METLTGFDDQAQLTLNFWVFSPLFSREGYKKIFLANVYIFSNKKKEKNFHFKVKHRFFWEMKLIDAVRRIY